MLKKQSETEFADQAIQPLVTLISENFKIQEIVGKSGLF